MSCPDAARTDMCACFCVVYVALVLQTFRSGSSSMRRRSGIVVARHWLNVQSQAVLPVTLAVALLSL